MRVFLEISECMKYGHMSCPMFRVLRPHLASCSHCGPPYHSHICVVTFSSSWWRRRWRRPGWPRRRGHQSLWAQLSRLPLSGQSPEPWGEQSTQHSHFLHCWSLPCSEKRPRGSSRTRGIWSFPQFSFRYQPAEGNHPGQSHSPRRGLWWGWWPPGQKCHLPDCDTWCRRIQPEEKFYIVLSRDKNQFWETDLALLVDVRGEKLQLNGVVVFLTDVQTRLGFLSELRGNFLSDVFCHRSLYISNHSRNCIPDKNGSIENWWQ